MSFKRFVYSRIHAFGHAFRGWWHVLKTQQNAWIHSVVATVIIILGLWLGIPARDWAVIVLTIAMVFTAEFINTAIEAVVTWQFYITRWQKSVRKRGPSLFQRLHALIGLLTGPLWARIVTMLPQ
jgi:diacylglycerol kinase